MTAGLRAWLPLIGMTVVVWLGITVALSLLIIPGIILFTIWAVAVPALVEEEDGLLSALSRSAQLTEGARWKVLGVNLVALIAIFIVLAIFLSIQPAIGVSSNSAPEAAVMLVINAVGAASIASFWAAAQSALFVELRDWKHGPETGHLGEIFA